jgi:hypothetical protein
MVTPSIGVLAAVLLLDFKLPYPFSQLFKCLPKHLPQWKARGYANLWNWSGREPTRSKIYSKSMIFNFLPTQTQCFQ